MKATYRVLAYLIVLEVFVQAAAIAFAVFGLTKWIDDGNTLDKAAVEDESTTFTGLVGFIIHGINGQLVFPLIVIIFLIVSFFAKVRGGIGLAVFILVAVAAQIALGIFAHEIPALGLLHGINALLILGAAVTAGQRATTVKPSARSAETV